MYTVLVCTIHEHYKSYTDVQYNITFLQLLLHYMCPRSGKLINRVKVNR